MALILIGIQSSSVQELVPKRANTLGLDEILSDLPDLYLPSHDQVAMNLLNWHKQMKRLIHEFIFYWESVCWVQ